MVRKILIAVMIVAMGACFAYAENAETFEIAKEKSAELGKPILIEFVHDD